MKELLMILFLSTFAFFSGNLFDDINFDKQGVGYKTNIPVIYQSIGKAVNESTIKTLKKNFKTTTALSFIYNDEKYYISIEEKQLPDFLSKLNEGDLIFIDIVVFNMADCYSIGRPNKNYCSYINKISQTSSNSH